MMKKILPYILIFVIIANFFAPFSVNVDQKNNPQIVKNIVRAEDGGIAMTITPSKNSNSIKIEVNTTLGVENDSGFSSGTRVTLMKDGVQVGEPQIVSYTAGTNTFNWIGSVTFPNLQSNIIYHAIVQTREIARITGQLSWKGLIHLNIDSLWDDDKVQKGLNEGTLWELRKEVDITTEVAGTQDFKSDTKVTAANNESQLATFACSIMESSTWTGCAARLIYTLIFQPTAWVFAYTGKFLDWAFFYSIDSQSYRSSFVTEGWALVRDLCNMFFIFVLLYIAIGTILKLHTVKTKEMIINVVIIGLCINFSLFATQVIIDTSNVMAKVFYNTNIVNVGDKDQSTGKIISKLGENGEIRMSEAVVNKLNPQQLIIDSQRANEDGKTITPGTFILVSIMASAVNIVGLIAFLSIGLIFITRVIGLWLAMVLAPLAFFTYTIPTLQDTKNIGWKKWWPETIKLAFLAPVFMFFMYIILKFLGTGLGVIDAGTKEGIGFVVATTIPFIFIMVLLMKAKDIAKDMSGELGQKITGAVAAVGGIALGGAALGTAFLGRKVIGAGLASASRSEDAMDRATHKVAFNKKVDEWRTQGANGPKPKFSDYLTAQGASVKGGLFTRIGAKLNEKQMKVNKIDHARHEIDETKKAAGLEGVDDMNLSGEDVKKIKTTYERTKRSEVEANVRRGVGGDGKDILVDGKYKGEEAYKAANRKTVSDAISSHPDAVKNGDYDASKKELTDAGKKKVENQLNADFNIKLKETTDTQLGTMFTHLREESKQNVNMIERGFARSNKASWDPRNISQVKTDARDGFWNKIPTSLIAGVAVGVRSGLKSSGINHGTGQGDLIKDLGTTITEALKSVKIEVPKAPSGGGHGGDSHGAPAAHH